MNRVLAVAKCKKAPGREKASMKKRNTHLIAVNGCGRKETKMKYIRRTRRG
jgi:hypothetical protein